MPFDTELHNSVGLVETVEDYLYSSARNYAGQKGLIEVDYW